MKVKITIDIAHMAREDQIPERLFTKSTSMSLELPLDRDDFLNAVDTLTTGHLSNVINRLSQQVLQSCTQYIEQAQKAGIRQPELPLLTAGDQNDETKPQSAAIVPAVQPAPPA